MVTIGRLLSCDWPPPTDSNLGSIHSSVITLGLFDELGSTGDMCDTSTHRMKEKQLGIEGLCQSESTISQATPGV